MFDIFEKQLINEFIKQIEKIDLKNKNISFEYDLTYDNKSVIGTKYECPRGNAASEKWSDRILSDTFTLIDLIIYKLNSNSSQFGHLMFQKYECIKILGQNISTINIHNSIEDFFSIDEYYSGIGIEVKNNNQTIVKRFFDEKSEHLARIIKKKLVKPN